MKNIKNNYKIDQLYNYEKNMKTWVIIIQIIK